MVRKPKLHTDLPAVVQDGNLRHTSLRVNPDIAAEFGSRCGQRCNFKLVEPEFLRQFPDALAGDLALNDRNRFTIATGST